MAARNMLMWARLRGQWTEVTLERALNRCDIRVKEFGGRKVHEITWNDTAPWNGGEPPKGNAH